MTGVTYMCLFVVLGVNKPCIKTSYKRYDLFKKPLVLYVCRISGFVMKTIYVLLYICRVVYYNVHVYILMICVFLYLICRILALYHRSIIILDIVDIYSRSYCSNSYGYSSIFPRLNYFIRTPIWVFLLIP